MNSTSQLTEDERNFARFFYLNFKVSPDIARRFFDGVFPPTHLAQIINNNMSAIMSLNKSRRINAAQLEVLRGVQGTVWPSYLPPMPAGTKATCSKDFDLTMIICLLRNLGSLPTPSNGWDQLPHPNDMLPGANLATLKWYRNQLAHTTVTDMDSNEFTDKWNRVEKALISLNKGQRPHEVTEIFNYDLNGEQAKQIANAELSQLKKEYMNCEKEKEQIERDFCYHRERNLPKNIADANATFVKTWLKDDKSFYETNGSELVYKTVMDCSCILVTSNSGSGKTAAIRHIALKLQPEGFEIVPVEFPEEIIKYKTNKQQVFLIDDVLGKYDLSPTLLDKWEILNENIIRCLEKELGSTKILCTMRSQITSNKRFRNASTILNKVVINLESESNSLSKEEKQKILIQHLTIKNLEKVITPEEVEIMCETNYAFPLLCKLVSYGEERFRKRIDFFRHPISLFRDELNKMSNENEKLYCILVICMLYSGSLSRSLFDNGPDEKITKIMQTCGLQTNMSLKELEDSAVSAVGSYFTDDSTNFRFMHDALEETVGYHFFKFNPKVMFSYCDILFIRDRVRIYSSENKIENVDENNVIIREDELNEDHLQPLYNRLCIELTSGRFSSLFMSYIFKNERFISIFGTQFENDQSILGSKHTFFKTISSERKGRNNLSYFENVLKLLSKDEYQDTKDAIRRVIQSLAFRNTLMCWIVAFGCNVLFQYAWSKMTTSDRNSILGRDYIFIPSVKSFFPLAVLGGSLDIVKELICSGADVNCFSEFWETPLYIAFKSGRYDMVLLLVKNGAKLNLRGWFTMNIPIVVSSNKQELISSILEYDLNQTELHIAVRHNDLEKLRSDILSVNVDSKTKSGWTVLHYAVLLNNLEAVKVLFHDDSTHADSREFLYRARIPKLNIGDNNGLTAVHLAVVNNNIEILSLLLLKKAEVKVTDVFDRTPLHYITSDRAIQLLLTHTSQNQCLRTNRNIEDETEYKKPSISALWTMCLNIILSTSFGHIGRDFVNAPDSKGNTPLHSVINRCILLEDSSKCVEMLLNNGANPYLLNDNATSSFELKMLDKGSVDMEICINDRAKLEETMKFTHLTFAISMVSFAIFTYVIAIGFGSEIGKTSKTAVFCFGPIAESGNITVVQVAKSIHVILPIIVLYLIFSIAFYDRNSYLWRFILFTLVFILSGSFILVGLFVYIEFTYKTMDKMLKVVFIYFITAHLLLFFKTVPLVHLYRQTKFYFIAVFLFLFGVLTLLFFIVIISVFTDNFYYRNNINTLYITVSNCTDFSLVNISCTSLANNITYQHGIDFSVQCFTDPNITSYNGTYGTLTVESEVMIRPLMSLVYSFWYNLFVHAICVYFSFQCIFFFKIADRPKQYYCKIISVLCHTVIVINFLTEEIFEDD